MGGVYQGLPLRPLFVVRFDRPMAPTVASRAVFQITSGTSAGPSLISRYDPLERYVVMVADPSQPQADLLPNTQYALTVKPSKIPGSQLAAYDGAPFEGMLSIPFQTRDGKDRSGADDNQKDVDPAQSYGAGLLACDVETILRKRGCQDGPCHPNASAPNVAPAMGLNLTSYAALQGTAIHHESSLVQTPTNVAGRGGFPQTFPYGMPIIDETSTNSFLFYKLLAQAPSPPGPDSEVRTYPPFPPLPDLPDGVIGADPNPGVFVTDLAAHVPGAPMPRAGIPLTRRELRAVRAWIDRGAPGWSLPCPSDPVPQSDDAGIDAAPDAAVVGDGANSD